MQCVIVMHVNETVFSILILTVSESIKFNSAEKLMEVLKNGLDGAPIWHHSTVHRKFQLKKPNKSWPYRQQDVIPIQNWSESVKFQNILTKSGREGFDFVVCIKIDGLKSDGLDDNQERLDDFRQRFCHPYIWTVATALPDFEQGFHTNKIRIPELEFSDDFKILDNPLRLVFKYKSSEPR